MSEFQPKQEVQQTIIKAQKLRDMVAMPGWTEIFEPELKSSIAALESKILEGDFEDLEELKLNQLQLKHQKSMLDFVYKSIDEADEIIRQDNAKITAKEILPSTE
jgi:hypothetical protein